MLITPCQLRRLIREEVSRAHFSSNVGLTINNTRLTAEVADTPITRQLGLMHRTRLEENCGMLFTFPTSCQRSFWMRNTYIPLSIAYLNESGRILNIEDMVPLNETSVNSSGSSLHALEMDKGWFRRYGIGPGDIVGGLPGCARN